VAQVNIDLTQATTILDIAATLDGHKAQTTVTLTLDVLEQLLAQTSASPVAVLKPAYWNGQNDNNAGQVIGIDEQGGLMSIEMKDPITAPGNTYTCSRCKQTFSGWIKRDICLLCEAATIEEARLDPTAQRPTPAEDPPSRFMGKCSKCHQRFALETLTDTICPDCLPSAPSPETRSPIPVLYTFSCWQCEKEFVSERLTAKLCPDCAKAPDESPVPVSSSPPLPVSPAVPDDPLAPPIGKEWCAQCGETFQPKAEADTLCEACFQKNLAAVAAVPVSSAPPLPFSSAPPLPVSPSSRPPAKRRDLGNDGNDTTADRPCRTCSKWFTPVTIDDWICPACQPRPVEPAKVPVAQLREDWPKELHQFRRISVNEDPSPTVRAAAGEMARRMLGAGYSKFEAADWTGLSSQSVAQIDRRRREQTP
jgi:Zn finger protein HypA/HybF involved in hydrogenase expression